MTLFTEQRLWLVTWNAHILNFKRKCKPWLIMYWLCKKFNALRCFPVPGNWHCVMHFEARRRRYKFLWSPHIVTQGFLFYFATVNFCLMKIYRTTLPSRSLKVVLVVWRGCFYKTSDQLIIQRLWDTEYKVTGWTECTKHLPLLFCWPCISV